MERTPVYQILVDGEDLSDEYYNKIEEVVYEEPEDGEAFFEIRFADHDSAVLDSGKFSKDHTNCALFMGYVGNMDFLMDGIVSAIEPDYPQNDSPTLKITVKNASVKMSSQSVNYAWKGKTYSDIAKEIAKKYNLTPDVDDTSKIYNANESSCVYQTGMSDYTFLSICAKKIGYTFRISYNHLVFKHVIDYDDTVYLDYRMGGCNLLSFKPKADSANKAVKYYSDNVELSDKNNNDYASSPANNGNTNPSRTHTVVKGEYLIKIAKQEYGDGNRYLDIYNANTDKVKMPGYYIFPGQTLKIP